MAHPAPSDETFDARDVDGDAARDRNEVRLVGRLSGSPERRTLPSGDEIVALRLVVTRPGGGSDTLPVQFGPAPATGQRRSAGQVGRRALAAVQRLADGERLEVVGAVRRRWWAGPDGRRSLVEVHAGSVRPISAGG
jgi:single-strand DNA-binding protein